MRVRACIMTLSVATSVAGLAAAPADAAVSRITVSTAGQKQIGQYTSAWGTVVGGPLQQACTQVLVSGKWLRSQCVTTDRSGGYAIPLTYGSSTPGTYTFRVVSGGVVSPTTTLTRTRYAPPPNYIKGRTTSGLTLRAQYNGVKVALVQSALKVTPTPKRTTMDLATRNAVKAFQKKMRLPVTGDVDANTYYAIKDYAPGRAVMAGHDFNVDSWMQPPTVASGASREARVDAMVNWALSQKDRPYVWGGLGSNGVAIGYDCSGFLLQALRAGGYNPKNVSNWIDIRPESDLSSQMWQDKEFPQGSLTALQKGDFIYYANESNHVGHVSMYIGNGQVINAVGNRVQISSSAELFRWHKQIGVNRMP